MNKKINISFLCLIILPILSLIIFIKFFSMPKDSDINWLEDNYQLIIDSALEIPNFSRTTYCENGEIPHDINNICKNLIKKNISYFEGISVRLKSDGTNSIIIHTWTNYYIYKNNRPELPQIGLPIVKKYKGWVVIDNQRD